MRSEDLSSFADGAGPFEAAPLEPIGVRMMSGDAGVFTPRGEWRVWAQLRWRHVESVEGGSEGAAPVGESG